MKIQCRVFVEIGRVVDPPGGKIDYEPVDITLEGKGEPVLTFLHESGWLDTIDKFNKFYVE